MEASCAPPSPLSPPCRLGALRVRDETPRRCPLPLPSAAAGDEAGVPDAANGREAAPSSVIRKWWKFSPCSSSGASAGASSCRRTPAAAVLGFLHNTLKRTALTADTGSSASAH